MRQLYDWMMNLAAHGKAKTALFWISFIESSFFPFPPDVMIVPMVIAKRHQAWLIAAVATAGSILGALLGYAIGYFLYDAVAAPIIEFYGYGEKFELVRGWYNEWGAWIVLIAGITPIPYKIFTIASGVTGLNLVVFVLASIIARGIRFFAEAGLLYWFGEPIRDFIERRFNLVASVFVIMLFGGFVAIKYLI